MFSANFILFFFVVLPISSRFEHTFIDQHYGFFDLSATTENLLPIVASWFGITLCDKIIFIVSIAFGSSHTFYCFIVSAVKHVAHLLITVRVAKVDQEVILLMLSS